VGVSFLISIRRHSLKFKTGICDIRWCERKPQIPSNPTRKPAVYFCGDDWHNFEPKRLNFNWADKVIRELRQIYYEKPEFFDVPTFAQKQY